MTAYSDQAPEDCLGALVLHNDDQEEEEEAPKKEKPPRYNSRKPGWWHQCSARPSKSQRRTMAATEDYQLKRCRYGEFCNLDFGGGNGEEEEVWVELGFGGGDNLLALARKRPDVRLLGAEVHQLSLSKVLSRMNEGVQRNRHWAGYTEFRSDYSDCDPTRLPPDDDSASFASEKVDEPYRNLRIFAGDGMKLLSQIRDSSIHKLLVTFPDPFPKNHHKEYRLMQVVNLCEMHRVLKPGGRLFLATDHEGCHNYSKDQVTETRSEDGRALFDAIDPCPDRSEWLVVVSKYERKGWEEGRRTWLSCWSARELGKRPENPSAL